MILKFCDFKSWGPFLHSHISFPQEECLGATITLIYFKLDYFCFVPTLVASPSKAKVMTMLLWDKCSIKKMFLQTFFNYTPIFD
jgi:hypothetical protein